LLRGGYVLWQSNDGTPDIVLIGTGSETHIALEAGRIIAEHDAVSVRVVSLPSWELFDKQSQKYRESVLPPGVSARVAVEAGIRLGWERHVGPHGVVIGLDGYGVSAPWPVLYREFGITPENVAATALRLLQG
jgi:transketolase